MGTVLTIIWHGLIFNVVIMAVIVACFYIARYRFHRSLDRR